MADVKRPEGGLAMKRSDAGGTRVNCWQAANYGANERRYFVCKPGTLEYWRGKSGNLVRFASMKAAAVCAARLNEAAAREEEANGGAERS